MSDEPTHDPTSDLALAMLLRLQLPYMHEHYHALATKPPNSAGRHLDYLERLVEGEANRRENRSIARRISIARFPVLKSLDEFHWSWPKKINRPQIQNLFRLEFIATNQRHPDGQRRPRQDPLVDRPGPCRLPAWLHACSSPPPSTSSTPWPPPPAPAISNARCSAT